MIIEMVTELFTVLARDPSSIRSLEERMVPVFLQVLDQQNMNKDPGVVSVSALVRNDCNFILNVATDCLGTDDGLGQVHA